MGLQELDQKKREQEWKITQKLFKYIDERKSLVFDAGAGSGKTYALVESIQYVIQQYGEQLEHHNQKIMCITYTNVAANNIKYKIGNSNLVAVSTIHERLWQLIKVYQKELLALHKKKIESVVADDVMRLTDEGVKDAKTFKVFRELSEEDRKSFEEIVWTYKDEFYQGYAMKSDDFRKYYGGYVEQYPNIMKSVSNFRTIVSKLYEIRQLKECLVRIEQGKLKNAVEYNAMYNQDRLWAMRISHDTLLEYGKTLVLKYPVLQQIIFDQFPFVFIDEYQDTSEKVVEIMATLDERATEIKHEFFVGYYGDRVQNIYDDGVGCRLLERHNNLERISKEFNRRSYKEIIDVANRLRLDGLQQSSIYQDCLGGSVGFCDTNSIEKAIEKCKNEWKDEEGRIHCLVLRNEDVAKRIGISGLYNVFKKSAAYSGIRFRQLNTELLSSDREKLGITASFLYRILKFYTDIRWEGTPVEEILYGDVKEYQGLDINELSKIKQSLQEIKGDTLEDFLSGMCESYEKGNSNIQKIIKAVLDLDRVTYNHVIGFFMQTLERESVQDEDVEENKLDENKGFNNVKQLLSISMQELEKWYGHIECKEKEEVIYHTFHGTKGLEFENVLIVLEDGFGTKKEDKVFIKNFFEEYSRLKTEQQVMKHEKARNLLYVAVTRAKKNLRLIYTGDSPKVREMLYYVFDPAESA